MAQDVEKIVRRFTWRNWDGFGLDDEIVEMSPERYVLRRDGELIIVCDDEVEVRL